MALLGIDPWAWPLHRFVPAYLLWCRQVTKPDDYARIHAMIWARPQGAVSEAASGDPDGFLAFERGLLAE